MMMMTVMMMTIVPIVRSQSLPSPTKEKTKENPMNTNLSFIAALGALAFPLTASADFADMQGSILLGGGYLEDPDTGYGFGQFRGTFYEDDVFAHTLYLEFLGHSDDALLEFAARGGGTYFERGDISFSNFSVNYELELKLAGPVSFYAGAGAGIEYVSIDDRFDFSIDSDTNFMAQAFAGVRLNFGNAFTAQAGARTLRSWAISL